MASTGCIQSSKLSGKYSYNISPSSFSRSFWLDTLGRCSPMASAAAAAIDDDAPDPVLPARACCGLDVEVPSRVGGLRSSSESERLMGRVETDTDVRGTAELFFDEDALLGVLPESEVMDSLDDQAGTGGRVTVGETATFFEGCCC